MTLPRMLTLAGALTLPMTAAAQDMPGMKMDPPAPAQDQEAQDHSAHRQMPGVQGMDMGPAAKASPGSGTALLPGAEGGMRGIHIPAGDWMLMVHGALTGVYTDQGGPRGDDMAFVESMAMLSASRNLGDNARFEFRTMMSLEPAIGQRGYPNLFASGETAHGEPLVDRQHPHDLFMELSARVEVDVAKDASLFVYGGPVAEPALGPSAFMHRRSDRYLALSPISHHWFDSTHITYGVVTAGVKASTFQLEGSAFNGREPDERRWDIDRPRLDSWSARATWTPTPNWAVQVSTGRLKEPEAMHPRQDEHRTTASVHYARKGLAAMIAFAAKDRMPGGTLTAWTGEATWDLSRHHSIFGRIENVANDELFPDDAAPLHDVKFRVTRFEAGYAYRIPLGDAELALGGSLAAYAKPAALDAAYGKAPVSYTLFARLALGQ